MQTPFCCASYTNYEALLLALELLGMLISKHHAVVYLTEASLLCRLAQAIFRRSLPLPLAGTGREGRSAGAGCQQGSEEAVPLQHGAEEKESAHVYERG